jgi:predicted O-methyltransferase YrrM
MLRRQSIRVARIMADPVKAWTRFRERIELRVDYARPQFRYTPDPDWERQLHQRVGAPFPCEKSTGFRELWPRICARVAELGHSLGPESYLGWNDGDPELVRAIWCLVRHLKPAVVVETGVGHGFTTRFILEALERNAHGRLFSIDLPPADPAAAAQVGVAVDGFAPGRWQLIRGPSRRELPRLLAALGAVDLFVHDSLHTTRHVTFEVEQIRPRLRPGGFIVIDDIDSNRAFRDLAKLHPGDYAAVCQSLPIAPDRRRFDDCGLFGLIQPAPL